MVGIFYGCITGLLKTVPGVGTIAGGAVKIAIAAFLVPFCFVFNQALLLQGSPGEIAFATLSAALGLIAVAMAMEAYAGRPLGRLSRLTLTAGGLLFLFVEPLHFLLACVLVAGALFLPGRFATAG